MLFLLLLATVSVVFAADAEVKVEVKDELKPEESAHMHDSHSFSDGLELMRHREERFNAERHRMLSGYDHGYDVDSRHPAAHGIEDHELPGPVILRTPGPLPHHGHPDIEAQNRIIANVFSPDYYQPTWVLDYRYLKTGGRDYTRGPGGQILILPKGVRSKEHKEFDDYDSYLEHLRLSRLAEEQHHHKHGHDAHRWSHPKHYGHDRHEHRGHEHHGHDDHHDHGHGQTIWSKYG
ncbi:uncharacterized protein LOC142973068 [Anticarsia gemmatalis]|uniref:uncharacterized protein LOC142973068 n=1 Tax=Anticarsia gemmatalis TaxID=129554 RepID=UPI003F75ED5A